MVTRCHRVFAVFFLLMKKVTFRRILAFDSSRKWSHLEGIYERLGSHPLAYHELDEALGLT